jgi:ankyrin repeat protein
MAKRNDITAVRWLLDHGAHPNALWSHFGDNLTPLHLVAWHGHTEIARLLLDAGADPTIHDSMHDSDVMGWAEYCKQPAIVQLLTERAKPS